jgi:hypothetical protein
MGGYNMKQDITREKDIKLLDDNNEFDFDRGELLEEIDITKIKVEQQDNLNEQ